MDERAAFEANIDANPLDATNRLVYADWLREHDEHDEGDFQQAMAEWVTRHSKKVGESGIHFPRIQGQFPNRFPWGTPSGNELPSGVNEENLTAWIPYNTAETIRRGQGRFSSGYMAPQDPTRYRDRNGRKEWQTYRNMEEAFRRAFMANRPQRQSRVYSRRQGRYYKDR